MAYEWESAIFDFIHRDVLWARLLPALTDRELHALLLWYAGRSLEDCARIMGVNQRRISDYRMQIRVKAERLLVGVAA